VQEDQRLSRIETKLDKLSEAVVQLARMEERLITLFNRMNKYEEKQEELEDRVEDIAGNVSTNGQTLRFAERVFWIIATGAISTLFWYFRV
jgi:predicted nuclease with TOPRIM domain